MILRRKITITIILTKTITITLAIPTIYQNLNLKYKLNLMMRISSNSTSRSSSCLIKKKLMRYPYNSSCSLSRSNIITKIIDNKIVNNLKNKKI